MKIQKEKIARIYSPAKSAAQSGMFKTKRCLLEIEEGNYRGCGNIMHWIGSNIKKVELKFPSIDAAIRYAQREGIKYEVIRAETKPSIRPKSYASNFTKNPELI